jgi:glycosyltransferase involved in cell wall biosynthesis
MVRWADVVTVSGVYSFPTIPTLLLCRLAGKPVVWFPHGSFQRWEGGTKPNLKRAWDAACDALLAPGRSVVRATSEAEAADCRARIPRAGVVVVPNGVDVPSPLPARDWLPGGILRLLYLGRLHPIKGIGNLLRAVGMLADLPVRLEICGSGEAGYERELRSLASELGPGDAVRFRGHVDGEEKSAAFLRADLCVVPSFSENFGMVVAEALAHGVPVIAGRGTPWAELESRGCGLWVENSPASLAEAVRRLRTEPLEDMGRRGREWMAGSFGWKAVASSMVAIYERMAAMADRRHA